MTREQWRDVAGFEGKYQVSTLGRVRSISRKVKHPSGSWRQIQGRTLHISIGSGGYGMVSLVHGSNALVHRLVAMAFLPNPRRKPCVNHLDGDKQNNRSANLQWVTYAENERHSHTILGKRVWNRGRKGRQRNHNTSGLKLGRLGFNKLTPRARSAKLARLRAA